MKSQSWFDIETQFEYAWIMSIGRENGETILKFKMPYWTAVYLLFVGNLLGFILFFPFLETHQKHLMISLEHICIVIWGSALVTDILLGFVCAALFKVKLKPNGISCFNFWGIYSFVLWDEIRNTKTFNFFGLKYVRVFFRNSRFPLWVPLFVKNRKDFSSALCKFAPPSNLLRQVFEQA